MTPSLVYPILAMASLTFILMPITMLARIRAVKAGKLKASNFRLMNLDGAPESVIKTTRHWSNLYEVPTVFYALCLLALYLQLNDDWILYAAWAYVVLRVIQGFVHLTYNKVPHRLAAFAASNTCLGLIFLRILYEVTL